MVKSKGKKQARPSTVLQDRLADEVIKNSKRETPLTKTQIARAAGYARQTVKKTPQKLFTAEGFRSALAARGITEDKITEKMDEGLDATQGSWFQGEYHKDRAPDLDQRRKYVSLMADMLGIKKHVVETRNLNITLEVDDIDELLGLG